MIENQKETPQEKPKSTPTVIVIIADSTSFSTLDQRPPAVGGAMEHEALSYESGATKTTQHDAQYDS